jgi:hypothetical protein
MCLADAIISPSYRLSTDVDYVPRGVGASGCLQRSWSEARSVRDAGRKIHQKMKRFSKSFACKELEKSARKTRLRVFAPRRKKYSGKFCLCALAAWRLCARFLLCRTSRTDCPFYRRPIGRRKRWGSPVAWESTQRREAAKAQMRLDQDGPIGLCSFLRR